MAGLSVNGVSGDGYALSRATELKEFKNNQELMFVEYKKQREVSQEVENENLDTHVLDDAGTPLSKADQKLIDSNKAYLQDLNSKKGANSTQSTKTSQDFDLIKMMKHLSDDTKAYLEKDSKFQATEQLIAESIEQRNKHKATIPDLKQQYIDAEKEYKALVRAGDFDAAQQAQDKYYNAQNDYQSAVIVLEVMDDAIDKASQNAFAYATTIERWEDGDIVKFTREAVGHPEIDNVYNKEFKMVTLSNGQKAYESEGKYYQLADDGLPNPYVEVQQ